jgi:DNA-binding MurR/RpiR family transcriptional regulator
MPRTMKHHAAETALPATPAERAAVDEFLAQVTGQFESLSRQLKLIARHVEKHRDQLGLERIQDVAQRCGVQPSAVIRFAKHFGFSGYSEMQKLFRDGIRQQLAPGRNYQARIRDVIEHAQGPLSAADIAHEFIGGSIAGMHELQRDLHSSTFTDAVSLLAEAPAVWLVGSRRSFPVAAYLAYALQHTDKQIQLVHGLGAMQDGQLRGLKRGDVMIVTSFAPYADESLEAARQAAERGARIIAITDSRMGPLAQDAEAVLVVHESSTFGFRSLTNTMCLAQSLFIALAYQLELKYRPTHDRHDPT